MHPSRGKARGCRRECARARRISEGLASAQCGCVVGFALAGYVCGTLASFKNETFFFRNSNLKKKTKVAFHLLLAGAGLLNFGVYIVSCTELDVMMCLE